RAVAAATRNFSAPSRLSDCGQVAAEMSAPTTAGQSVFSRARMPPQWRANTGAASRDASIPTARNPGRRSSSLFVAARVGSALLCSSLMATTASASNLRFARPAGARAVVERHGAQFPSDPTALRALPGIGDYTAAAIAAIAFDHRSAAVDGNVERVVARLFAIGEPLPQAKPRLRALATALVPEERAGDFAQAMMDLGAVLCTPRRPRCVLCPWRDNCAAAAAGIQESLPARAEKPERPRRYGVVFWLRRD